MNKIQRLKRLKNKAKKLWRECVFTLYGHKCIVCGSISLTNAHHIAAKEYFPALMYAIDNGIPLCPTHHKYGRWSAHKNPLWFWFVICKTIGEYRMLDLYFRMQKVQFASKWTEQELEVICRLLSLQLTTLQA